MVKIDPNEVFCGWEEIAGVLQVSEKTARRYEKTEGLRVRRLVTDHHRATRKAERGRIYVTGKSLLEFLENAPRGR